MFSVPSNVSFIFPFNNFSLLFIQIDLFNPLNSQQTHTNPNKPTQTPTNPREPQQTHANPNKTHPSCCGIRTDQSSCDDQARTHRHLHKRKKQKKSEESGSGRESKGKSSFSTFTILCFRIKSVSCAATLRSNTTVASNRVVTSLCLQAFVIIDLTFVDVLASVGEWIEGEADLTVTSKAAGHVCADLVGIAGLLIQSTLDIFERKEKEGKRRLKRLFDGGSFAKLTNTLVTVDLIALSALEIRGISDSVEMKRFRVNSAKMPRKKVISLLNVLTKENVRLGLLWK
jgi:hypothetical protein